MSFGHYGIDPRERPSTQYGDRSFSNTSSFSAKTPIFRPNKRFSSTSRSFSQSRRPMTSTNARRTLPAPPVEPIEEKYYELFDTMMDNLENHPRSATIERTLIQLCNSSNAYIWFADTSLRTLHSETRHITCTSRAGIIGYVFQSGRTLNILRPKVHKAYDELFDIGDFNTIYLPLSDDEGVIRAVAQIVNEPNRSTFTDKIFKYTSFFQRKFAQFAYLLVNQDDSVISAGFKTGDLNKYISMFTQRLQRTFQADEVQYWICKDETNEICMWEPSEKQFVKQEKTGVVGAAIKEQKPINSINVSKMEGYDPEVDRNLSNPIMMCFTHIEDQIFGIVVRDKQGINSFSLADQQRLEMLTPVVAYSICSNDAETSTLALRLKALLEVAEILSGVLDIDVLIPTIMDRSCSLLNTERCTLFLVDANTQELVSTFQGGLNEKIRVPIGRGIAGNTAQTGVVINITDAYQDSRFDQTIDQKTGFKTMTLLTVPIYNNRGEIAGVTEMINRKDGSAFDKEDIKMMNAFNVFCGISLDNAKLYQSSLDLTRQLRGFMEMSTALNKTRSMNDVLKEVLMNARNVVHATKAKIFLYNNEAGELTSFVSVGEESSNGTTFAKMACQQMKTRTFSKEEVMQILTKESIPAESKTGEKKEKLSRVSSALSRQVGVTASQNQASLPQFEPVCCFPLMTADQRVLGVMEINFASKILPEDIKLLDCFAVFAAVSLEKNELEQIAKMGQIEMNLQKWISDKERKSYDIPFKLRLDEEKIANIFSINFNAPRWEGIGYFKVLFTIFDSYKLLNEFDISCEKFYKFIAEISQTYNKVPYHNWRHAVDVSQFVNLEIRTGELSETLTKFEIFGLLISAICHDANHDGFTNVYNVKAETPLGILFKNQSVLETHHCTVSIGIISKEQTNIFAKLDPLDEKRMWTNVINLILATDMAKHHDFLTKGNAMLDKGELDTTKEEDRLFIMQLLLKCGDISNVSRPFELADQWCDVLCEEFFRQGDLEKTSGMEYTSPLNDREHLNKPKSQIGFYNFVCLPLYQVTARAVPQLQVNVDQIKSNLAVWTEQSVKNDAAAAK